MVTMSIMWLHIARLQHMHRPTETEIAIATGITRCDGSTQLVTNTLDVETEHA